MFGREGKLIVLSFKEKRKETLRTVSDEFSAGFDPVLSSLESVLSQQTMCVANCRVRPQELEVSEADVKNGRPKLNNWALKRSPLGWKLAVLCQ
jgi:hypothetical protein